MEETRKALEDFFDEMFKGIPYFKKKSYEEFFKEAYEKHRDMIMGLPGLCGGEGTDEAQMIEDLASVIPSYVGKKSQDLPKRTKDKVGVDYNLTMAAYVIPMLCYQRDPRNERIAERMVEIWNDNKVTAYTLQKSDYDQIAKGFKKGLCYITTAVCVSQGKPDDCLELTVLRRYRDRYLMQTEEGRTLVEEYYNIAPVLVHAIDMQKDPAGIYDEIYRDYLCPCIDLAAEGENEACKRLYTDMVENLKSRYAPLYMN